MKINKVTSTVLACLLAAQIASSGSPRTWARIVKGVTKTYDPFELEIVTEQEGRLVATAHYTDYGRTPGESHLPSKIRGVRTADGQFWPEVKLSVSNEIGNNWQTIDSPALEGVASMVTLQPNSQNEWLHVDLKPFERMIGRFKYGAVSLTNGGSAIFETKNLLPPQAEPHYWQESALPEVEPFTRPPFVVMAIMSPKGDDPLAVCAYRNASAISKIDIQGTKTPDGRFWPYVTTQVASDYAGAWVSIERATQPGDASTISLGPNTASGELYVNLTVFQAFVGKFRYGRLIMPNGETAIFELRSILPPEQEHQEH